MIAILRLALSLALVSLVTGCASTLSGVGGSDGYACKAPEGVLCTSVSGIYANSMQNNLPSQRTDKRTNEPATKSAPPSKVPPIVSSAADGTTMRSAPRVLRVWIAPWEDTDGDLQDQSYLYIVVDTGRWLIEHARASIRKEFTPITAPNGAAQPTAEVSEPSSPEAVPPSSAFGPFSPAVTAPLPPRGDKDDQ